jgi:RNA 3'-terminal phosphate cyclase (ATP)
MVRPGFYPRGGGEVQAVIQGNRKLHGLTLGDRGPVSLSAVSAIAGLPDHIARRQARRLTYRLEKAGHKVAVDEETWEGGPGSVVLVTADTTPAPTVFWAPGARGKPAEAVADEAADEMLAYLNAGAALVDVHSADQVVLPLALAEGRSEYRIGTVTEHLTTNIAVIRRFIERDISCDGTVGGPGTVRIA